MAKKNDDLRYGHPDGEEDGLPTSTRTFLGAGSFVSSVVPDQAAEEEDLLLASPSMRAVEATITTVTTSWVSKTFMSGCAILLPVFITLAVTSWIVEKVDGIFSPMFKDVIGFYLPGLGFLTAMAVIFMSGMLAQSWVGGFFIQLSENIFAKVPFVTQIYSAAKQIGQAIDPKTENAAFKECVLIKHPRHGEYALAFVTGHCFLEEQGELVIVYVPTNHMYVGDIYMLSKEDVIHTNLTVGEGLEVVVSMGMAMPKSLASKTSV
ncbi:hypothetical protein HOP50_09g57460 [Chloropicon primus]|uniref:DUF502 domain-containing protein n=1 Tax=Chloropicon primus TaxID=1764295 RepID=A0A5B8MRW0_9CHLO|nr:hypothetical protein A3770_09p57240 [Chloropicon primus]UPR02420.1 hypothetical protein HOP50_09g57460 [Chloropicon primus]|eukprot:QDZ23206.1 hypothetical protein A3770_09p57240 [Chloropicon primus]